MRGGGVGEEAGRRVGAVVVNRAFALKNHKVNTRRYYGRYSRHSRHSSLSPP